LGRYLKTLKNVRKETKKQTAILNKGTIEWDTTMKVG